MPKRLAFMDPLVLAVAADEKTVTRRLTDPGFKPGDVVDVCEALAPVNGVVCYQADSHFVKRPDVGVPPLGFGYPQIQGLVLWPWKVRVLPARYCPSWAVRHRIEIVSVRSEPLAACTDEDARREGIARMGHEPTAAAFLRVFRELHGLPADADPTVFRVEFRRVEVPRV
jgi:hypothetical protein